MVWRFADGNLTLNVQGMTAYGGRKEEQADGLELAAKKAPKKKKTGREEDEEEEEVCWCTVAMHDTLTIMQEESIDTAELLNFKVGGEDSRGGRGGRGGRGRGGRGRSDGRSDGARSGRGRGGRGGRGAALPINDTQAFPSLG